MLKVLKMASYSIRSKFSSRGGPRTPTKLGVHSLAPVALCPSLLCCVRPDYRHNSGVGKNYFSDYSKKKYLEHCDHDFVFCAGSIFDPSYVSLPCREEVDILTQCNKARFYQKMQEIKLTKVFLASLFLNVFIIAHPRVALWRYFDWFFQSATYRQK